MSMLATGPLVSGQGRARIMSALKGDGASLTADRFRALCPGLAGVNGVGIMLMAGNMPSASFCVSDAVSQLIEDLQFTLGEGPCVDAFNHDAVVTEPDLAEPAAVRWPAFSPSAVRGGVRAVFGYPLRVGTVRLGSLDLYRDRPGPLSTGQYEDALVIADVLAEWVLEAQSAAPSDAVAAEIEVGADFHFSVHNAAGIVSIQEGIGVSDALIRLRAYAFSNDLPLADVARDVISRKIRLR